MWPRKTTTISKQEESVFHQELKDPLAEMVRSATEVLSDEDALEIVRICKEAVNREIADATEQYLTESIGKGDTT